MIFRGLEDNSINDIDYAFTVEPYGVVPSNVKCKIPTLMPLIDGSPSNYSETINTSLVKNDPGCKPTIKSTVSCQKYITIPRCRDINFTTNYLPGQLPKNSRYVVHIPAKDLEGRYLLPLR